MPQQNNMANEKKRKPKKAKHPVIAKPEKAKKKKREKRKASIARANDLLQQLKETGSSTKAWRNTVVELLRELVDYMEANHDEDN